MGGFMVLARGLAAVRGRGDDAGFEIAASCTSAIFIFWPILYDTKSFVSGSWMVAYILAPLSLSASFPWLVVIFLFLLEAVKDTRIENFTNDESRKRILQAVAAITVVIIGITFGCVVYLRHGFSEPDPATVQDTYTCTWPCAAVRAAVFMSPGFLCFALALSACNVGTSTDDTDTDAEAAQSFFPDLAGYNRTDADSIIDAVTTTLGGHHSSQATRLRRS